MNSSRGDDIDDDTGSSSSEFSIQVRDSSLDTTPVHSIGLNVSCLRNEPKAFLHIDGGNGRPAQLSFGPAKLRSLVKHWRDGERRPQPIDVSSAGKWGLGEQRTGQPFAEVEATEAIRATLDVLRERIAKRIAHETRLAYNVVLERLKMPVFAPTGTVRVHIDYTVSGSADKYAYNVPPTELHAYVRLRTGLIDGGTGKPINTVNWYKHLLPGVVGQWTVALASPVFVDLASDAPIRMKLVLQHVVLSQDLDKDQ